MNFIILGDGDEEFAWVETLARQPEHRLIAAYPGFAARPDLARPIDLDDALATAELDAVIIGGATAERAESLRRVAAAGLAAICLHPPGDDSEAYYQVALSRAETGAVVVPDLALRRHPGVVALRTALQKRELGLFRSLRHEATAGPDDGDLARHAFARMIDVVRSLIGEVEAVTATGDPPGERPSHELVVQVRGPEHRRGEVRIATGPEAPSRLILTGSEGALILEYDPACDHPARLIRRPLQGAETTTTLDPWDPRASLLDTLSETLDGQQGHPDLNDGTRAMELAEAAVRSLRRGRTIELHYEQISEAGTFKSVMTSLGCVVLLSILAILPAALAGPALGLPWTIYIAYAIPPALVVFILMQLLRFAIRAPEHSANANSTTDDTD